MMAGNPNWWSMNNMHPQFSSQFVFGSSSSLSSDPSESDHHHHQDFPIRSWSQLVLGDLAANEEENRFGSSLFQQQKKLQETWYQELQALNLNPSFSTRDSVVDIKQDYDLDYDQHHQFQSNTSSQPSNNFSWPHQLVPVSSPTSCITNLSHSLLNFSGEKTTVTGAERKNHQHNQEHSSECNSSGNGGVSKKARVQQSSPQPALKVRKEKLGDGTRDRITALHQIVSPFGKTDTASVLSEAIRHIRFHQAQIEALSSPYMRNASANTAQHSVQERNIFFHEEHGQDSNGVLKDLRSRGLCLVPISYTQHVGNNINGAEYWAPPPALGGGF